MEKNCIDDNWQKLEPIIYDEKLSAFNVNSTMDEFETKIVLEDYDWMHYTLSSRMPTKKYGVIKIEFEYFGAVFSEMRIETKKKERTFRFDTKLFREHMVKFLQKHIRSWDEAYAFDGIEEVVNFYNAVLASSDTVEE